MKIDADGKTAVFAAADAFPVEPLFLNDVAIDGQGVLYVSDSGDLEGGHGAVFRISPDGKATLVTDSSKAKTVKGPNGLLVDDAGHVLMLDFVSGELSRVNLDDGKLQRYVTGFLGGDGLRATNTARST